MSVCWGGVKSDNMTNCAGAIVNCTSQLSWQYQVYFCALTYRGSDVEISIAFRKHCTASSKSSWNRKQQSNIGTVYTVNTHLRNVSHLLSSPYCLWMAESAVDPGRGRLETVIDQLVVSLQRTSLDTLGLSLNDPATKHRGKKGGSTRAKHIIYTISAVRLCHQHFLHIRLIWKLFRNSSI